MRKKMFLMLVAFFTLSGTCIARDIYIAQTAAGSGNGSSCENADAIADLTWGAGNMVTAGDTLHLCGTLTSPLTVGASGTTGNVITVLFEPGAKFSAATWTRNYGNSSGVITLGRETYITIDGGTNGIIEATANGHGLANQNDWVGVFSSAGSNITIKNLSILNMNVRASNDDSLVYGIGIFFVNVGSNNTVQNCTITYAWAGVYAFFQGSLKTGLTITGNTCNYDAKCLVLGDGAANSMFTGVTFSNNTVDGASVWFDTPDDIHSDGIHIFAVNGGTSGIDDVTIKNNTFGANFGAHCTAQTYIESAVTNVKIYNNVYLQNSSYGTANGSIYSKTASGPSIYNNTFIGGVNAANAITLLPSSTGNTIKNNIFYDYTYAVYWDGAAPTVGSDYNAIYSSSNKATEGAHSKSSQPSLDGSYIPTAGDTVAKDAGVALGSPYNVDKLGVARPQGAAWDIGAFESVNSEYYKPEPPRNLNIQ